MKARFKRRTVLRACSIAFALAIGGTGYAFKPNYESYGHTMISRTIMENGYDFGALGEQRLQVSPFRFSYSTTSVEHSITQKSIDHILIGVRSRDWLGYDLRCQLPLYGLPYKGVPNPKGKEWIKPFGTTHGAFCISADLDDPDGHFDNDNFIGSVRSIVKHIDLAIDFAVEAIAQPSESEENERSTIAARVALGKALHTLQDFYAHSTWTDSQPLGVLAVFLTDYVSQAATRSPNDPLPNFPAVIADELAIRVASKDDAQSVSTGGGTFVYDACTKRIHSAGLGAWTNNDGNWVVNVASVVSSAAWWSTAGGLAVATSPAGWNAAASDSDGSVRCDHGAAEFGLLYSGIAKDKPNWPLAPGPIGRVTGLNDDVTDDYHESGSYVWGAAQTSMQRAAKDASDAHLQASFAAAKHTKLFLETFVAYLKARKSGHEADQILSIIFGGSAPLPSVTWVVDRSGTMADALPAVQSAFVASNPVSLRNVLVDFVGTELAGSFEHVTTIGDAATISSRLAAIEARGGGGCTTPMWSAIEKAVEASLPGSTVVAITDASASDASKEQAVKAAAQAKQIKLVKVITGSCSPIDPSYVRGAQDTGGSVKLVPHEDGGIAAALATLDADQSVVRTVHTEAGTLNASKTIGFPVETAASKLTLVANGSLAAATLTQPNGSPLVADANATITPILNGYVVAVTNPQQGNWQVTLTGTGDYALSAYVNATIDFEAVEHKSVIKVGRPGHEYRPQLAPTGQSGRVWLKAKVVGAKPPLVIDLLRLDGSTIASYPLSMMTDDYFEGEITLPTEAHRFRARGLAADGTAFARILGQGNVAPPAAQPGRIIASQSTSPTWRAGTVNAFAINLKNLGGGDSATLAAGALPTGGSLVCSPGTVQLPGSEQVNVLCSIQLPESPDRADFVVAVTTASGTQQVTIPLRPLKLPLSCALDIDGDNRVDAAIDGVLLTRYLLGFRGTGLTEGLTIPGPRKTDTLLSAFFGNAAQFDLVGRAQPAPTATVDGLLMTRLMLGYDDASLLTGINLPAGAQYTTAAAIKDNVVAKCAGGF